MSWTNYPDELCVLNFFSEICRSIPFTSEKGICDNAATSLRLPVRGILFYLRGIEISGKIGVNGEA